MKKLVYVVGVLLVVCSCQVRHDHSKHMQQVRVPVDSAQKNYVDEDRVKAAAEAKDDEGVYVMPEEPKRGALTKKPSANVEDEIERMMKGEDTCAE